MRRDIADLHACLRSSSGDVRLMMILAADYRLLGQPQTAIEWYLKALQYDRRPELYFNLGLAQLEATEISEGLENLTLACIQHPIFVDKVPSVYRAEVRHGMDSYQLELDAIKRKRK